MVDNTVILLWTGGWDSTFRLLQLLQDTDALVQPLYLVDEGRPSATREIETIRQIRKRIHHLLPQEGDRLLPTEYGSYQATAVDPEFDQARSKLNERVRVGKQYAVLASYARQCGVSGLELSILAPVSERGPAIASLLNPFVERKQTPVGEVYALRPGIDGPERMFRHFHFPLLDYTKLDIKEEAERRGLDSIMSLTTFCHDPIMGFACGVCHPCQVAKWHGLGHRVGFMGPVLSRIKRYKRGVGRRLPGLVANTLRRVNV